ncbi:unnamed protein product [Durusdinium trenchii]|uniref:Uncharacterized protein n=1 Tax=Durusdinium trenchii TaxID=1381693 RepID=A0ABP0K870_9DINO
MSEHPSDRCGCAAMASGWPWRWSRWTDSPKEKQLQPEGYEMEERLLALLAGVHQQVVADAQHSEQLATLSRRRSDVRMSTLEEQHRRLEMRLNDLSLGLKSLEQAAGLAGERAWQDLTQTVEQQQEALRREEELQHHVIQRLKPLEERLNALEAQLFLDWPPQKVQVVEALDSETSFRSCPSREDRLGVDGARWHHLEGRVEELSKLQRSTSQEVEDLALQVKTFAGSVQSLAQRAQDGFAAVRGHLDQVLQRLGQRSPEVKEVGRAGLEERTPQDSATSHLLDDFDRSAPRGPQTGRPPREQTGRTSALVVPKLDLCPELAQLTQALQHFGSAIRQAEERLETPQSREVL